MHRSIALVALLLALPLAAPAKAGDVAAPSVTLKGADVKHGQQVPLIAVNSSAAAVSLQRAIIVERWQGGRWQQPSPGANGLLLRADCRPDARTGILNTPALLRGCIGLAPRSTFSSAPWLGTVGDAQCLCERCTSAPPGLYRYTARHCGKATVVHGLPFRLK